jgi:hypothetical protein
VASETGMPADLDQQALAVACRVRTAMGFDSDVIPQRPAQKNVVPAANVKGGDLNIRKMLLDGPLLPICVVVGVREPIKVIRRKLSRGLGARRKRWIIERRIVSQR